MTGREPFYRPTKLPGADGVAGTILHLGKVAKDPFFDAGQAPQGTRVQLGTTIRRWDPSAGTDKVVWDPFNFLDPLTERTDAANSDPAANSNMRSVVPCAGASLQIEEWMHANSLPVAPTGVILMSVRHLDTVIAISPQFDRISWRIGPLREQLCLPNPSDRFYHEHYVRMLENGNLIMFDNGDGRTAAEGGQYSRALELALDWGSMTAAKVWEYRHQVDSSSGAPVYKYADKVGTAQRLENGNTLVLFGADFDPRRSRRRARRLTRSSKPTRAPRRASWRSSWTSTFLRAMAKSIGRCRWTRSLGRSPVLGRPWRMSYSHWAVAPTPSCQLTVSQWNWYLTNKINPDAPVLGIGDGTQLMTVQQYLQARRDAGL